MTTQKDYDVSSWFRDDNQTGCKSPYPERERQRSERIETESFYLSVSNWHFVVYTFYRTSSQQCWHKILIYCLVCLFCSSIVSSSSRMRVINHSWSATKQRPHPQSAAEISRHSVLSGDRIQQCIVSKWLDILSYFLRCMVAQSFWFSSY